MKHQQFHLCWMMIAALLLLPCHAQDEAAEPIELTRLREQFSNRIEQEMKPWRDRYAQELQKLEDRLIKERKLTEALAVKKEKENYLTADLSKKVEKPSVPATAEKAKEAMLGTVWLVYSVDDKKRENLLDIYYFKDNSQVYFSSSKQHFPWTMNSKDELSVKFTQGVVEIDVNFLDSTAESVHMDRPGVMFKVGALQNAK
jgi:hypothetical protein